MAPGRPSVESRHREHYVPVLLLEEVEFTIKPRQAQAMISRAIDAGVPIAWFTADKAYGRAKYLQTWLEDQDVSYVMAIRCSDTPTMKNGSSKPRGEAGLDHYQVRSWRARRRDDTARLTRKPTTTPSTRSSATNRSREMVGSATLTTVVSMTAMNIATTYTRLTAIIGLIRRAGMVFSKRIRLRAGRRPSRRQQHQPWRRVW